MEKKLLIFGGTIEGRKLSDLLCEMQIPHEICVATEYGEEVLEEREGRTIHTGRLMIGDMCSLFQETGITAVVDATHPYAVIVSENIRLACQDSNLPYLRYLRAETETEPEGERIIWVNSAREAARVLEDRHTGRIFLTTGSKELSVFTDTITDKSRIFARVLPSAEVVASCRSLGLEGKQICAMQGPFSREMNIAMLRQTGAAYLVTKNTGASGGFPEKMQAVQALGLTAVVIRRPQEEGDDLTQILKKCAELLQLPQLLEACPEASAEVNAQQCGSESSYPQISCIGIGMGSIDTLTHEAADRIREAEVLFGARRILQSVQPLFDHSPQSQPTQIEEYIGTRIAAWLQDHPQIRKAAILMSGDVGFYSGAKGVREAFAPDQVQFYPGISSIVYFASKVPTSWQDAKLVSAHGKEIAVLNYVKRYPKLILLVSSEKDIEHICGILADSGLQDLQVTVGSNLSYPQERIDKGAPQDFRTCSTSGLHILMLENPHASHVLTPGIPDESFIRGKVPMTKEEIRILSVAALQLKEHSIVYDVGAGTGSISIEAARLCTEGKVYAIEKNPEGISLIRQNTQHLGISNLVTVEGLAPAALEELPVPDCAFIGGSSGNMKEILLCLLEKNPSVRIVINTIALESISEVMNILRDLDIKDAQIVQVMTARSRTLGRYHMMTGQNPVYIISFGGK